MPDGPHEFFELLDLYVGAKCCAVEAHGLKDHETALRFENVAAGFHARLPDAMGDLVAGLLESRLYDRVYEIAEDAARRVTDL